jgi:hypothetical protein
MSKPKIIIPRRVLLVEIERRCRVPECNAQTRIGLTKDEARTYSGFECERCKEWNTDALTERDVPEWWEALKITDLYSVRELPAPLGDEPGAVIARLSDDYRRTKHEE